MIAYKLFRELKDGTISTLFINKKSRLKVEIKNYTTFNRPESQGGTWLLANEIKILEKLNE